MKKQLRAYQAQPTAQAVPPREEVAPGSGIEAVVQYLPKLQNPDDVARQKGLSYYASVMMQNSHIAAEMQKRVLSVVNKPRRILPAKTPDGQMIAEFVRWNFEEYLNRGWTAVMRQVLQGALVSGVSVQEILWNPSCSRGKYRGYTVIEDVKDRDPERFLLDNNGNVYLKKHLWDLTGELQHPKKFIVFAWLPEYENPYGAPILRALRWHDWFQRQGMTYWMIFLEKFSQPTVIGTYPSGATKDQKDMLQRAIESVQVETGIRIPDTMKIEFLEAARSGEAGYELLKDTCNREISKVIAGQTLTTETTDGSGAYALGYVHNLVRADLNAFDCQEVDRIVNNTLIAWLVDYNFPVDYYPRQQTQSAIDLMQAAALSANAPQPQRGKAYAHAPHLEGAGEGSAIPLLEGAGVGSAIPLLEGAGVGSDNPLLEGAGVGQYAQTDRERADELFANALKASAPVYEHVWGAAYAQAIQDAATTDDLKKKLDSLTIDAQPFADFLLTVLISASILGIESVQNSLGAKKQFEQLLPPTEPLTIAQAAQYIRAKKIMPKRQFDALTDELKRVSFTIAGKEDAQIQAAMRQRIAERLLANPDMGLRELEMAALQAFRELGVTGQTPYHAATVFRTNIQSAYNDALFREMQAHRDEIAFVRYHAQHDAHVRPAHLRCDMLTLAVEDMAQGYWPPLDFNCRCWLEIITNAQAERQQIRADSALPRIERGAGFTGKPGNWQEVLAS